MVQRDPSYIAKMQAEAMNDSKLWFPGKAMDVVHATLGLCGEVGEFANVIKKIDRGDVKLTSAVVRNNLTSELADVFTYTLVIGAQLNVDLERLYYTKRQFNAERFGKDV
jgi:NTP pyrophosphatase (non-canonical NTP hydrolase)